MTGMRQMTLPVDYVRALLRTLLGLLIDLRVLLDYISTS